MDGFAMVRSFDEAGYHETRVILMIIALAISLFFAFKKEDNNYIVMFISSTIFFGIVELILFSLGMRAEGWTVTVFGLTIPTYLTWLFQGLGEGAIYGVSGFLFLDMYLKREDEKEFRLRRNLFIMTMIIVFICAIIVGIVGSTKPITSVRPMFGIVAILYLSLVIIVSFVLAKYVAEEGFLKHLRNYLVGSFIFTVLNLEIMHIFGTRYIGVLNNGNVTYAHPVYQVLIMFLSYFIELVIPRAHYLVIPVVLGLIKLD